MIAVRLGLLALLLLGLANCASPAEIAARQDATCQSYGLVPGSPGYAECRMRLAQMQHEDNMQRRAALSQALMNAGDAMSQPAPVIVTPATNPTINCTTQGMGGGMTSTSCH